MIYLNVRSVWHIMPRAHKRLVIVGDLIIAGMAVFTVAGLIWRF